MKKSKKRKVLITGGAGYVGSRLIPKLIKENFSVIVYDTFWYGRHVLPGDKDETLKCVQGDIRDIQKLENLFEDVSDVIHLACISNDPSFDLNPALGRSINLDAFEPLVKLAKINGVTRFIYASSSSVYGVKLEENVTEDLTTNPLTDYSRFKVDCENILMEFIASDFTCTIIRPATICGFSPRQRFDLSVNILTNHAINNNKITVYGGSQFRPNIHIEDMVDCYIALLNADPKVINSKIYNIGTDNLTMDSIATEVQKYLPRAKIVHEGTNDLRSYRINSAKIEKEIGFRCRRKVGDAIQELVEAFRKNIFQDSLQNSIYFNIKRMQELGIE